MDGIRGSCHRHLRRARCLLLGHALRSCRKTDRSSGQPHARQLRARCPGVPDLSLDKVGCDIRSRGALSGRRPQASLNAGSKRSHVRGRRNPRIRRRWRTCAPRSCSAYLAQWVVLAGSRASDRQPARRKRRQGRDASRSRAGPARRQSDNSRPPANRTHSSLFSKFLVLDG